VRSHARFAVRSKPALKKFAADLAMEVPMLGRGPDVELLAPIDAVGMADQADILEDSERPVHRGRRGCRVDRAAPLDEIAARDMAVRPVEDLEDQPALRRPTHPRPAEMLAHVRDGQIRRRSEGGHRTNDTACVM